MAGDAGQAARVATAWWVEGVIQPVFAQHYPGKVWSDRVLAGSGWAQDLPTGSDGLVRFAEVLERRIVEQFREYPLSAVNLDVDYHPEGMLADALEEAGVDLVLPFKTGLSVFTDHIMGIFRAGWPQVLWHTEDWERPLCGSPRPGVGHDEVCGLRLPHIPVPHGEWIADPRPPRCRNCGLTWDRHDPATGRGHWCEEWVKY